MITSRIDLSGPFFQRDPANTVAQNIGAMLTAIAKEAEADVRQQMQAGESRRAPVHAIGPSARVSSRVRGRVQALGGKQWRFHAVISPDRTGLSARQAVALNAAASRIERRSHPFARTGRNIRTARFNLAKGLE